MKIMLSIVLLAFCFSGVAQTGTLRGIALDESTGDKIPFVKVTLHLVGETEVQSTQTDFEGVYSFGKLAPGSYVLAFFSTQYEDLELSGIIVRAEQMTIQKAQLTALTSIEDGKIIKYVVPEIIRE